MKDQTDVTDMMRRSPVPLPPDDFTGRVMRAVARTTVCRDSPAKRLFLEPRRFTVDPLGALKHGLSWEESLYCFLLIGFAHLTLAFVLFGGLRNLQGFVDGSAWVRLQPLIVLLFSIWFFLGAALLWRLRQSGLALARIAVITYVEIVAINGALPVIRFGNQWFLIPFAVLTVSCLLLGGWLALALHRGIAGPVTEG